MTSTEPVPSEGRRASPEDVAAEQPVVLIVGNPNTGKTTLFNRLSGMNARVGNYPGVTVERRAARVSIPNVDGASTTTVSLVDVPGAYSLTARSAEEQIAIDAALGFHGNPRPDLVVVCVDAGQLTRNLYLVLQLLELEVPILVALNMIDEAGHTQPSATALAKRFGVPCVATNARKGEGIDDLRVAIGRALERRPRGVVSVPYPAELVEDAKRVAEALPPAWRSTARRDRSLGLWALTSLDEDDELVGIEESLRRSTEEVRDAAGDRDVDREMIAARYRYLDSVVPDLCEEPSPDEARRPLSERVDAIVLHPVFGFAIFIAVMLVVFQSLFAWADPAIGLIEVVVGALQVWLASWLPEGALSDLVTQGIVGGVGNVVVFLPQIVLLFLFIGLLEASGYMARVAYLMDRVMKSLGLHGRAFVPMLSGFACAVPAILATRTMERQRDRVLTMLVIPLMTCSARLPVYTLIIAALFPPSTVFGWIPIQGLLMISMYLFAVLITLISAAVLGRTAVKGRRIPLILELPPYRMPTLGAIARIVWERSFLFVKEAGTVILACTVVLWALLYFPRPPDPAELPPTDEAAEVVSAPAIERSYGGRMGKAIEPVIEPLGFDWKIGVGIIGAFAAREVFISTMAIVYGLGEVDDEAAPLRDRMRAETRADGRPAYTPLVGLSLMVFFALACQCMSTLAVVRRETKSWRWPAFMFGYMTLLAYAASLLVFQGGRLLGFA